MSESLCTGCSNEMGCLMTFSCRDINTRDEEISALQKELSELKALREERINPDCQGTHFVLGEIQQLQKEKDEQYQAFQKWKKDYFAELNKQKALAEKLAGTLKPIIQHWEIVSKGTEGMGTMGFLVKKAKDVYVEWEASK